jgi:hypothetical protein
MPKYILSFVLCFFSLMSYAQEEEGYYKEFAKRSRSFEIENLPNLDSRFSSFYVGVSGAFRKPYHSVSTNAADFGVSEHPMGDLAELNLGLNFNNNYFVETGLRIMKNNLTTYVYATPHNPGFTIGHTNKQFYLPVIVKKKIMSLNRVTKNAQMNIGAGGGIMLATKPRSRGSLSADLQQSIQSPDLVSYYVTLSQSDSPIYGEVNLEIKGNITERLEILVFTKGMFRQPRYLENSFNVDFNGGRPAQNYSIFEKSGSLIFGLQIRLNSRKFYRYSSVI